MNNKVLATELLKIASIIIAEKDKDYKYIYDPDHKKHPGNGYTKTENGWTKGKQDKDKSKNTDKDKSNKNPLSLNDDFNLEEKIKKITNPKILEKFSSHNSVQIRKHVAFNPNTSKETLAKLAKDENYNVRIVAALNKNLPEKSQIDLCEDENPIVRSYIAIMKLPQEGIEKLLKDDNANVRAALAFSENATPETLANLSKDKNKKVKENVARNKNTPEEILDKLSDSKLDKIKENVAGNENTSTETLEKLANYKNSTIQTIIAGNENASSSIISYIYNQIPYDDIKSYHTCIWNIANNHNTSPEILENLFNEIEDSFNDGDLEHIKYSISKNINTPGHILEKCLKTVSNNDYIKKQATITCQKKYGNESVYLDEDGKEYFIDQLQDEFEEQKKNNETEAKNFDEYIDNITSGNGELHKLEYEKAKKDKPLSSPKSKKTIKDVIKDLDFNKKEKICSDQQVPSKLLDVLSDDKDANIRALISVNKKTNVETLNKLSKDKDVHVRNMVMFNPNCPIDLLKIGTKSQSTTAKMGVALNPNTTTELYAELSNDLDYTVSSTAQKEWKKKRQKDMTDEQKHIDDEASKGWHSYKLDAASNIKSHPKTLEMLSYNSDQEIRGRVGENPITSIEILKKLSEDESPYVRNRIIYNKNCPENILKKLSNDMNNNVADSAKKVFFERQQELKFTKQKQDKLPKFKFKGDDKTQAIIRSKFEKEQDEQETDTIYGEMAKFSEESVAPMGAYHGRNKEQLKADFIKKMNPANYSSIEAFQNAIVRVQKLSANDFSRMLASIFADDEETEETK